MCGFVGVQYPSATLSAEALNETIRRMTATLIHRGPDEGDVWVEPSAGLALGHRRLAVVDLSESGHQPMRSPCGRYVLVYNGEIYNHLHLRRQLEAEFKLSWRGHSDTETLLAGMACWGIHTTLERIVGMFAWALYDRQSHTLTLVRDRLGEKPLYYGWQGGVFLFGSELKALKSHPLFRAEVDRNALDQMLRVGYLSAPHTIYQGIHRLPPGSLVEIKAGATEAAVQQYWSVRQCVETGRNTPFAGSAQEAVDHLDGLLRRSIRGQMMADVPLGAFLSGGYDSSAVVALMQAQSSVPVKTFTIGFREDQYDESPHAAKVARHLGTEHTTLHITSEDAMAVIPRLPEIYDEPFADPSQIPTVLLSQLARGQVTVSVSGDGGDELFGGYERYFRARKIWAGIKHLPKPLRTVMVGVITGLPVEQWNRMARGRVVGDKLHKLAGLLEAHSSDVLYGSLNAHWPESMDLVCGVSERQASGVIALPGNFEHQMMYQDVMQYLPDDILVKLDRAAMATSLETRIPLLDHRIVAFAWQLPLTLKMRNTQGKWILRQLVHRYVPQALVDRPKMGFGIPLEEWLRGPLRDWADALLDENRLNREGYLKAEPIRLRWEQHRSGQRNWAYSLWNVLMFQAWVEAQKTASRG